MPTHSNFARPGRPQTAPTRVSPTMVCAARRRMRTMALAEGEAFAGYTILRLLGSGGMGEVYLVQHPRLPRREALKVLPAQLTNDPEYRTRFDREAAIVATLWHPNIVALH